MELKNRSFQCGKYWLRRLLHFPAGQCSSSPSWWHHGVFSRNTPDFISPLLWPPNSPDLNTADVDYEVWGMLQQRVYRRRICDVDHLKQCLIEEWRCFDQNIIDRAVWQWRVRLRARPCKRRPLWAQTVTDVFFVYELLKRLFHIGNLFLSSIFKTAVAQKLCGEFCCNL